MIAKEYKQYICKKRQKVLLLALVHEDINAITWTTLAIANIKMIKQSLETFTVNVRPSSIDTIRFSHK